MEDTYSVADEVARLLRRLTFPSRVASFSASSAESGASPFSHRETRGCGMSNSRAMRLCEYPDSRSARMISCTVAIPASYTLPYKHVNTHAVNAHGHSSRMGIREVVRDLIAPDLERTSLNALAKRLGLNQPTLYRLISGETKRDPKRETLEKIAKHYRCSVDDLYSGAVLSCARSRSSEDIQAADRHYGPPVTDKEASLLRDLRELLPDRWDYYSLKIREEANVARAYKAMGHPEPVSDERVSRFIGPAPAVPPVERRSSHDRRTARVITSEGNHASQRPAGRRIAK